jgi:prepilin-type N-terminal cleavage/methylation domain-containing protein
MKTLIKTRNNLQAGYTLIELLVAIAISSVLAAGIAFTITQIFDNNTKATMQMEVIQDTTNSGFWLNKDALGAAAITTGENAGFPLSLGHVDQDDNQHLIIYSISEDELIRSAYQNDDLISKMIIADHVDINENRTNCILEGNTLTVKITSTVSDASETRIYKITSRIDQTE